MLFYCVLYCLSEYSSAEKVILFKFGNLVNQRFISRKNEVGDHFNSRKTNQCGFGEVSVELNVVRFTHVECEKCLFFQWRLPIDVYHSLFWLTTIVFIL